ncbi:MAG: RDD family protein [Proteobacteria bacterium]|nr:RDD family protein [Pseudomonadota bacterium]
MLPKHPPSNSFPSLARQFAAILYDLIALAGIWFFAALVVVISRKGAAIEPGNILFTAYLLATAYAYFGFCWTRTGQTLGMKSWKIRVVGSNCASRISWRQSALRFCGALVSWSVFGLGFFWVLIDRNRRSWHDRLSTTRLTNV